jgi:hypothetical protein
MKNFFKNLFRSFEKKLRICTVDEIERHAHILPSRVLKPQIITVANVFSWFI